MRIAVTGASGNVGSALLRQLGADDDVEVVAVARRLPDRDAAPFDAARWVTADVADETVVPTLVEAFRGVDAVVHLAWQIQPSHDQSALRRTNVDGTRHVVAAAAAAGVRRFVHASSVGVYAPGPKDRPVDESWPASGVPTSSYSRHKAAAERVLDELAPDGMSVARLRTGLVFQAAAASEIDRYFLGPYAPSGLAGRLRLPALPVPTAFRFQAVHADDVAEAYRLAARSDAPGAFNVAAGPVLGPDDLARALGARRSVPLPVPVLRWGAAATWRLRLQPTSEGWVDLAARSPVMSTQRAERELGWRATTDPRDALAAVVEGLRRGIGAPSPPLRGSGRP